MPVYGEKHIKSERPFTARLEGDRWIVKGSLPKAKPDELIFGGTAMAEINKQDLWASRKSPHVSCRFANRHRHDRRFSGSLHLASMDGEIPQWLRINRERLPGRFRTVREVRTGLA